MSAPEKLDTAQTCNRSRRFQSSVEAFAYAHTTESTEPPFHCPECGLFHIPGVQRPFRLPKRALRNIPARYDPFALATTSCAVCRGTGLSHAGTRLCRCVYRRLRAEESRCRDRWELLYLAAIRDPDHLPPHPVPRSWFGRLR